MVVPSVNEDAVLALMASVHHRHEQRGWDSPPVLGMIKSTRIKGVPAVGVEMFPVQPAALSPEPVQGLLWMGGEMRYSEDRPPSPLYPEQDVEFLGVLFVAEGYSTVPGEDGSFEVRFVHALDVEGRYYTMMEYRDGAKEPWMEITEPSADHTQAERRVVGNVSIGLRDVMLGIDRTNPGLMDVEKVAAIGVETLEGDDHVAPREG